MKYFVFTVWRWFPEIFNKLNFSLEKGGIYCKTIRIFGSKGVPSLCLAFSDKHIMYYYQHCFYQNHAYQDHMDQPKQHIIWQYTCSYHPKKHLAGRTAEVVNTTLDPIPIVQLPVVTCNVFRAERTASPAFIISNTLTNPSSRVHTRNKVLQSLIFSLSLYLTVILASFTVFPEFNASLQYFLTQIMK